MAQSHLALMCPVSQRPKSNGLWNVPAQRFFFGVFKKQSAYYVEEQESCLYDVYRQWENDLALCKADLEHLLKLLERGGISPSILDRIPLSKVPRAHALMLMESKRLAGFLVCEPWMKAKQRAVYM
jgi:hypothetical protein